MACCSSDIGHGTAVGFSPRRRGVGRSSIAAVCTSANERNICCNSGRFTNFANRLLGLKLDPSGAISIMSTTSPKVAAHPSKCSIPRSLNPFGSRNRCIVYISTIVFEMGVPVANVTPCPS